MVDQSNKEEQKSICVFRAGGRKMTHNPDMFRAMVVEQTADGRFESRIKERAISDLPDGDVLVKVHYSSLNYKDALSAIGNKGVTRHYPHTPGIDAAGEVVESRSD